MMYVLHDGVIMECVEMLEHKPERDVVMLQYKEASMCWVDINAQMFLFSL